MIMGAPKNPKISGMNIKFIFSPSFYSNFIQKNNQAKTSLNLSKIVKIMFRIIILLQKLLLI